MLDHSISYHFCVSWQARMWVRKGNKLTNSASVLFSHSWEPEETFLISQLKSTFLSAY